MNDLRWLHFALFCVTIALLCVIFVLRTFNDYFIVFGKHPKSLCPLDFKSKNSMEDYKETGISSVDLLEL